MTPDSQSRARQPASASSPGVASLAAGIVCVISGHRSGGQPAPRTSAPSDWPGPISTTASSGSVSSRSAPSANRTVAHMCRAQ
ncbi:hypothetical protein [Nonomuraea dietziae]|uniref:hypothetical protein n=1 Tax=Nonomuraea dietziae TaxID=65515 RepID=UPI0031E2CCF0